MSGPKGGAYRVESAAQREARLLREAKARYAHAQSLWRAANVRMTATAATVGKQVNYPPPEAVSSHADSATYERAAQELEAAAVAAAQLAAAVREEFADAQYASQVERINAVIDAAAADTSREQSTQHVTRSSRGQRRPAAEAVPVAQSVDWARTGERVRRRLSELAAVEHDAHRVRVLVGDIAMAKAESRVDLLVSELDLILADARAATRQAEAVGTVRAQLEGLAARIADIGSAAADSVRSRIASLMTAQADAVPADLTAAVEELLDDVDAQADRQHVIAAMRRALEHLGYTLGPEFATDLGSPEGTAFAGGPKPGYGVKVRLEPEINRFSAQAVKSDAVVTTADEDVAAERQFCDAFAELIELVQGDGVALDVDIALQPGECDVQQVAADKFASTQSREDVRRVQPREMRRQR